MKKPRFQVNCLWGMAEDVQLLFEDRDFGLSSLEAENLASQLMLAVIQARRMENELNQYYQEAMKNEKKD